MLYNKGIGSHKNYKKMSPKIYHLATGLFFAGIAILHLLRVLMGWEFIANGAYLPMWISWVGVLVFGYLAYYALSHRSKR